MRVSLCRVVVGSWFFCFVIRRLSMSRRMRGLGLILLLAWTVSVSAQSVYPNRPIRFIVGFPPGGSTDVAIRAIAPRWARGVSTGRIKPRAAAL